jgi:hypothetical protein
MPAAIAAVRGSPPGRSAATPSADAGRTAGSLAMQRRMVPSTAGSRLGTGSKEALAVGLADVEHARFGNVDARPAGATESVGLRHKLRAGQTTGHGVRT